MASHAITLMGVSSFFIAPHELGRGQLRPALHNRMEFPQRFPVTRFQNVRGELIQHRRHRGEALLRQVSGAQQIADLGRSNEGSGLTSGWIERFLYTSFHYRNSDGRCPTGCRLI